MKLRIDDISAEAKNLAFDEPQAEINRLLDQGPIREYHLEGPVAVQLSYYRSGMEVFFNGTLEAAVTAICARCAEQFNAPCRRDFRFVLAPAAVGEGERPDLDREDLEFSLYAGEEIVLSPLIREQVLLALPTRPLCREECQGLCSRCGANLNTGPCACQPEESDPRLEIFRTLKISRP